MNRMYLLLDRLVWVIKRVNCWTRQHGGLSHLGGWVAFVTIVVLFALLGLVAEKNRELEAGVFRELQAQERVSFLRDRANAEIRRAVFENYDANMANVSQALTDRESGRHTQALLRSIPRIGSPVDPRGPEWWMNFELAFGSAQIVPNVGAICAKLIDEGRKSAIWTAKGELGILDHASGQVLFTKKLFDYPIRRPCDIPISEDGSTVAIPIGFVLQVYRRSGNDFDLIAELELERGDDKRIDRIEMSCDGDVVAVAKIDGTIRTWDLATQSPFKATEDLGKVFGLRLSANGRFLAFFQEDQPMVLDLATDMKLSLQGFEPGEFHGLAFGQYDTLVVWSNSRAITLGIDEPRQLTELWQTPIPCPHSLANSRSIRIERDIKEWIILGKDSQGLSQPILSGRLNSGNQSAAVHATILLSLGANGTQMLYREPAGTYPISFQSRDGSIQPDRITQFTLPNIKEIADVTADGEYFLLHRSESERLIVPRSKLLCELKDFHSKRGEMQVVAWNSDDELVSMTKGATYHARSMPGSLEFACPELNRLNTATSGSQPLEYKLEASQASISGDGKVVVSLDDDLFRVRLESHSVTEYQFRVVLPEQLFDNGTVNLFVWNRFDNQFQGDSESVSIKPIDLPWILAFQNESSRNWDRASEKITTRLFLIDYQQAKLVHTIEIPLAYVNSVAIRPDGRELAVFSNDKVVRVWGIADDKSLTKAWERKLSVDISCMSYRGRTPNIVAGTNEGDVYVLGPKEGSELLIPKAHNSGITAIAFSACGKRILTGGVDNTVRMLDSDRLSQVFKYSLQHTPTCIALSPSSTQLAIGDTAGHVIILPVTSKNDLWRIYREKLNNPELAGVAREMILRELWAEYIGLRERDDEDIEMAVTAIESVRGRLDEVADIDQLRRSFLDAIPSAFR